MRIPTLISCALIVSGCTLTTSLDGWSFEDFSDGGIDAGTMNSGPQDAGDHDASLSCSPGLVACRGECIDLDSSPDHCGSCGNACPVPSGTLATCLAAVCGVACAAGRADCNDDLGDGCEIDTEADALNCGGCGVACDVGLSCREAACRPKFLWVRAFGSTGEDHATAVAFDAEGNVYVAGNFQGTVSFGGAPLSSLRTTDMFVASYGPDGEHRWSLRAGGGGSANAITVDEAGHVYVTGHFVGPASFGGDVLSQAGQGNDIFIASYEGSSGAHRWSVSGGGGGRDVAYDIALDASGNVYVIGEFSRTATFNTRELTSDGPSDIFLASYTPTGALRWANRFGGPSSDHGKGIAVDSSGNIYLTGQFDGTVTFPGGTPLTATNSDVFVASYAPDWAHRWSIRVGGPNSDDAEGIVVDAAGSLYVSGRFIETTRLGGTEVIGAGLEDVFLASYSNSDGSYRWSRVIGGPLEDAVNGLTLAPSGSVYLAGVFAQMADFGAGPLAGAGEDDAFLASYAGSDGAHESSMRLGGIQYDSGLSIAVSDTRACIAGFFSSSMGIGEQTLIAAGFDDVFIACFEQ